MVEKIEQNRREFNYMYVQVELIHHASTITLHYITYLQTWNLSQAPQAYVFKIILVRVKCLAKHMFFVAIRFGLCTNTRGTVNHGKFTL